MVIAESWLFGLDIRLEVIIAGRLTPNVRGANGSSVSFAVVLVSLQRAPETSSVIAAHSWFNTSIQVEELPLRQLLHINFRAKPAAVPWILEPQTAVSGSSLK
eukprot:1138326-Pelagomonas_calceolata.AAC.6